MIVSSARRDTLVVTRLDTLQQALFPITLHFPPRKTPALSLVIRFKDNRLLGAISSAQSSRQENH